MGFRALELINGVRGWGAGKDFRDLKLITWCRFLDLGSRALGLECFGFGVLGVWISTYGGLCLGV